MHLSIYSLTYSDNSIYSCIYKTCMYNQNQIERDREGSLTSTISPGFAHGGYCSRDNQNVHELCSFLEFKGILIIFLELCKVRFRISGQSEKNVSFYRLNCPSFISVLITYSYHTTYSWRFSALGIMQRAALQILMVNIYDLLYDVSKDKYSKLQPLT